MEHPNPAKRPSVVVEDSKWTRYFIELQPLPCSNQPEITIKDRRDELVGKVRCMIQDFISNNGNLLMGMSTVDALERLGVAYHFEQEIATFMDILSSRPVGGDDLCAVALQFRLLRQHHYDITCDVFKNFINDDGSFKHTIASDVDALLSLFEAAHLSKCNEDVLNRALVFTVDRLTSLANDGHLPKPILDKVLHALASPTYRRTKRHQAKVHISIYEDDKEINQDILELAKLDFHILQQMHRDEVKDFSLWYKDLNPRRTLGQYIRERPVECYYWSVILYHEPHYVKARMMYAKMLVLVSFFDDIFDSYGTLEEVHRFNQAVQSWDEEAAGQIGNCYAYMMSHMSKTFESVADAGASPVAIDCLKESMMEISKCMLQEVVWREERQAPTVDDYLKQAAAISVQYVPMVVICFAAMDAKDELYRWACSFPKIIEIAAVMCRLMDDVAGHENEKEERSKCFTAVDCYMKEHGGTVEQAKKALGGLIEDYWRRLNQECLSNDADIPVPLLTILVDLVRTMDGMYIDVDMYSKCSRVADHIHTMLNECVDH